MSCASGNSSSGFTHDIFIGELKPGKVFGNFTNATALSVDAFGNIYIVDAAAPGIFKFDANGDSLRGIVGFGKAHNQFDGPSDIDASLTNSVAIADRNNHRIEIYSKDLIWQASIEGHIAGGNIHFGYPSVSKASPSGNYYIIDNENKRALCIQPATGRQTVISVSGTESGATMNPGSLSVDQNEFITIADLNSSSIVLFNNALLPEKRIPYIPNREATLFSSDNILYSYDKNSNILQLFDAASLVYTGSLKLPETNQLVAFSVYKNAYYILTKEHVIRCSKI